MKKLLLVVLILFILQASVPQVQGIPQCQDAGGYKIHIIGVHGDYSVAELRGREVIPFTLRERTIVNVQFQSVYIIIDETLGGDLDNMIVGAFYVPELPQCQLTNLQPTHYCPPNLPPWFDCAH